MPLAIRFGVYRRRYSGAQIFLVGLQIRTRTQGLPSPLPMPGAEEVALTFRMACPDAHDSAGADEKSPAYGHAVGYVAEHKPAQNTRKDDHAVIEWREFCCARKPVGPNN